MNARLVLSRLLASVFFLPLAAARVDFNRDVRPILNAHCTACHGGVKQAAGVSFLHRDKTLASGKSGRATVVPGKPAQSELLRRITLPAGDPDRMPPADHGEGKPLSDTEIQTLRRWIAEGAHWGVHPLFVKPTAPTLPKVRQRSWPRSALDRFILARLESEKLTPAPEAPAAQWLRRVSFDLTGLPPSLEETDRFLRGEESHPQAVERLLKSPHFGERWASLWLDLARYADTQGYEKDNGREVWPWRDWLVRSLNADMPFDQFTLKTLAGDLLPNPSLEDRIATGFHRNTQTNTEGGTDDEEYRLAAVIDRVNTTWTVWQGTTFGCVQCHAHPYDAFRQEDYYRFLSLWNSTEDADMSDDFPRLAVPNDAGRFAEAEQLDREILTLRSQLNQAARPLVDRTPWKPLSGFSIQGPKDATFSIVTNEVRVEGTVPNGATYTLTLPQDSSFSALRIDLLPRTDNPKNWPEHGAVIGHLWMEIENPAKVAAARVEAERIRAENKALAEADAADAAEARKNNREIPKPRPQKPVPTGIETVEFAAVFADNLSGPYDPEESLKPGWAGGGAFPKLFGPRWLVFVPDQPVQVRPGDTLRLLLKHEIFDAETKGSIVHHFRLATDTAPEWTALIHSAERSHLKQRWAEARKQRESIPSSSALVMRERPDEARRETRLFLRGNFLAKDRVIEPGAPGAFPPFPAGPTNRLTAARWLVSPDNPLTARVQVNRVWAELFGTGIIETVEDFGSAGQPPSHPELLDHLALRFQHDFHWSLKTLLREIVLSATYRQDHRVSPASLARDPQNRLLSRGPRTRLSAEMIRDQALVVSGLLNHRIGGPPVMPPQPEGVWQVVYNGSQWITPKDGERHRRALYTYWRRTSPYPSFLTFDASSRETCTARRVTTSTPLQALVTLNDPVYVEAAQALAGKMSTVAGSTSDRIAWAWRQLMGTAPHPNLLARLTRLHSEALTLYSAQPELASKAGGNPETAAATLVATTLLNTDEALVK